jgi:small subunit ribosomal protein S20
MPKSRTVLKRQRQTAVRRMRNKGVRSRLHTDEKQARAAAGTEEADQVYRRVQKDLDTAAAKGVVHPNKAARKKSRLAKLRNAAS